MILVPDVILIKKGDVTAAARSHSEIAGRRLSAILLVEQDDRRCRILGCDFLNDTRTIVSRTVVDDDDFVCRDRLAYDAFECLADEWRPVVKRDCGGDRFDSAVNHPVKLCGLEKCTFE